MNRKIFRLISSLVAVLMISPACNLFSPGSPAPVLPAATLVAAIQTTDLPQPPAPSSTVPPTQVPLPLYRTLTLGQKTLEEQGQGPDYTLKAVTPVLQGSRDPRVEEFNRLVAVRVQSAVDQFKQDLSMASVTPIAAGSYFSLTYALTSPPGNFLSLRFQVEGYTDGAAHPYHYTTSFNYDLEAGQELSLAQLFLPGTDYLKTLADYCSAELGKREIGFEMFSAGAEPTPENYAVWNLSTEGLVITFNEYQVAAYAAGPQEVTIPFEVLNDQLDPLGPLRSSQP
jgi:hypothetical protein